MLYYALAFLLVGLVAGVVSGVRAATNVLKQRMHHEGGASNGT